MSSPSRQEFDDATRRVERLLTEVGEERIADWESEASEEFDGVRQLWRHGKRQFLIVGEPNSWYFTIAYPFWITESLASQLHDVPILANVYGLEERGPDEKPSEQAVRFARELLDGMRPQEKHALMLGLTDRLSTPETAFRTQGTGGGGLDSFECSRKIFPYDDDFTRRGLNDAVQSVVSVGHLGMRFVEHTLTLQLGAEESSSGPSTVLRFFLPTGAQKSTTSDSLFDDSQS